MYSSNFGNKELSWLAIEKTYLLQGRNPVHLKPIMAISMVADFGLTVPNKFLVIKKKPYPMTEGNVLCEKRTTVVLGIHFLAKCTWHEMFNALQDDNKFEPADQKGKSKNLFWFKFQLMQLNATSIVIHVYLLEYLHLFYHRYQFLMVTYAQEQ